jgi:voltage-gated potassium channel
MEEIGVSERCEGAGRTVGDIRGGSVIVALRKADGSLEPQPPAEAVLEPGDKFMALGSPRTLERLERLFQPDRAPAG